MIRSMKNGDVGLEDKRGIVRVYVEVRPNGPLARNFPQLTCLDRPSPDSCTTLS